MKLKYNKQIFILSIPETSIVIDIAKEVFEEITDMILVLKPATGNSVNKCPRLSVD